jgi:hypothetical protein
MHAGADMPSYRRFGQYYSHEINFSQIAGFANLSDLHAQPN